MKQIEDITYIRETEGLDKLPENLEEVARLRLERPEASLKELGEALNPPVGKSGVNHRLRKLSILAEELREKGTALDGEGAVQRNEEENYDKKNNHD